MLRSSGAMLASLSLPVFRLAVVLFLYRWVCVLLAFRCTQRHFAFHLL